MNEEQMKKMLEELASLRKEQKGKIQDSIKNYDRIIYPSFMTMKFPSKQSRRMKKIKNIFDI
jgi:hypothetical protein